MKIHSLHLPFDSLRLHTLSGSRSRLLFLHCRQNHLLVLEEFVWVCVIVVQDLVQRQVDASLGMLWKFLDRPDGDGFGSWWLLLLSYCHQV